MKKFEFDFGSISLRKVRLGGAAIIRNILVFVAVTFAVFVASYIVIALFFSTGTERRLWRENVISRQTVPILESRKIRLEEAIAALQHKDEEIYRQVFHSQSPDMNSSGTGYEVSASDTVAPERLALYTSDKADKLFSRADAVEDNFRRIAGMLASDSLALPPMKMPVSDISFTRVGASVGDRYNPFYKTMARHNGIDLMTPTGVEVYAPADGVVLQSQTMSGTMGTMVRLSHEGGYETVFSHLGARYVKNGQKVKAGDKIGTVGVTGNSFAPHLHYEIYLHGVVADPVNYFFASVGPYEYVNMVRMSADTRQSMD